MISHSSLKKLYCLFLSYLEKVSQVLSIVPMRNPLLFVRLCKSIMRKDYAEIYIEPRSSYKEDFVYFKGTPNLHVSRKLRKDIVESFSFIKILIYLSIYAIVLQGKDLPAKDLSGTSDPYVRVTLLPDKKHRLETKIKRRTLNPRWNETFYFEGERMCLTILLI